MIQRISTLKLLNQFQKSHNLLPKITPSTIRHATTDKQTPSPITSVKENWTEIYRLPLIRIASAFNRLKVYQTIITAIGTPMAIALEKAGQMDPNFGVVFAAIGITGVITLTVCSIPVQNLIGFVYMNEAENKIKVAYVDFWGRRKHQELVIDDILAPWEMPPKRLNIYQAVKSRENETLSFKLLNRYGVVCDPQRYVTVFGDDFL